MGGFDGFGERLVDFYEGLAADNSKPYWTEHRTVYEEQIKEPMLALLADLEPEFGATSLFRPYRDIRFSKDKSPYKTSCAAMAGECYLQVSAEGLLAAGGHYQMAPDQLQRFRAAVDDERRGEDLRGRVAAVEAAGLTVAGEQLKSRPRGVDPDHPRIELLRHRTLYAWRSWPPDDVLHTAATADRVRAAWRAMRPLTEWLDDHVGRTELSRS